jgi:hypothetical protein
VTGDIPHSEKVFGRRTPDDGHIQPNHAVNVKRRRRRK